MLTQNGLFACFYNTKIHLIIAHLLHLKLYCIELLAVLIEILSGDYRVGERAKKNQITISQFSFTVNKNIIVIMLSKGVNINAAIKTDTQRNVCFSNIHKHDK